MPDRLPKPDAEQIINTRETTEFYSHLGPMSKGSMIGGDLQVHALQTKRCRTCIQYQFFLFCSTWLPSHKHNHLRPRAKEQAANILHLTYSWVTVRAHFFDIWWISVWWSKWHCPWSLVTKEHSFIFKKRSSFWCCQHIILKVPCIK